MGKDEVKKGRARDEGDEVEETVRESVKDEVQEEEVR